MLKGYKRLLSGDYQFEFALEHVFLKNNAGRGSGMCRRIGPH